MRNYIYKASMHLPQDNYQLQWKRETLYIENWTEINLIKWARLTSPVIWHVDIKNPFHRCIEKDILSFVCYFYQKEITSLWSLETPKLRDIQQNNLLVPLKSYKSHERHGWIKEFLWRRNNKQLQSGNLDRILVQIRRMRVNMVKLKCL